MYQEIQPGDLCLIISGSAMGECVTAEEYVDHVQIPGTKYRSTGPAWKVDKQIPWFNAFGQRFDLPYSEAFRLIKIDGYNEEEDQEQKVIEDPIQHTI